MNRQPGYPKGMWVEPTLPAEEVNYAEVDFGPSLTPEQRKWPVVRFPGVAPRHPDVSPATPPADTPRADA